MSHNIILSTAFIDFGFFFNFLMVLWNFCGTFCYALIPKSFLILQALHIYNKKIVVVRLTFQT